MNIKEILHILADGVSLIPSLRTDVHDAIEQLEDHKAPAPQAAPPNPKPSGNDLFGTNPGDGQADADQDRPEG